MHIQASVVALALSTLASAQPRKLDFLKDLKLNKTLPYDPTKVTVELIAPVAIMNYNKGEKRPNLVYTFDEGKVFEQALNDTGAYQQVRLKFGWKVKNKNLRCRLIDTRGDPIIVGSNEKKKMLKRPKDFLRFAKTGPVSSKKNRRDPFFGGLMGGIQKKDEVPYVPEDSTFGKGFWQWPFEGENAKKLVCDPAFKALGDEKRQLQVVLTEENGKSITINMHTLEKVDPNKPMNMMAPPPMLPRRFEQKPSAQGPFTKAELKVGLLRTEVDLRCQLVGEDGKVATLKRDDATFTTFSDYKKGAWKLPATKIKTVICGQDLILAPNTTIINVDRPDKLKPGMNKLPANMTLEDFTDYPRKEMKTDDAVEIRLGYDDRHNGGLFQGTSYLLRDTSAKRQELKLTDLPPRVEQVSIEVGSDVELQDIRCQLLDKADKPIEMMAASNGNNWGRSRVDTTFGVEGWRFYLPFEAKPVKVVCDPAFRGKSKVAPGWWGMDPKQPREQVEVMTFGKKMRKVRRSL